MSNGILPVQSVRGTLREWIMNNAFPHTNLGAEFFNRLMNLCAYDYPMTPNLHGAVSAKFGEGVTAIIEGFSALEKPVFNTANRLAIRRIVPDEFYLEFLRLFDCSCCPAILGEYSDEGYLPTDAQIGELAILRYSDDFGGGVINYTIELFEWDGAAWNTVVRVNSTFTSGLATLAEINIQDPNWEVSVDSGATWDVSDHAFSPAVSSFPIWAKNIANGCIYTSVIEVPFEIEYCVSYGEIYVSDFLFNFGTINGADASNPPLVLATYVDWEGNTNIIPSVNDAGGTGNTFFTITLFYPSDSVPPTDLGLYSNDFTDPPVSNQVIPVSYQNCVQNCYQAVFTVDDPTLDGVTSLTSEFGGNIDTDEIMFTDPSWPDQYLAVCIAANFLEPTATMSASLNGNEVTFTICSIVPMASGLWSNDDGTISGPITFTQLP